MKEYSIINSNDGNDTFTVEAQDGNEAAFKALDELGWMVSEGEDAESPNTEYNEEGYRVNSETDHITGTSLQGYIDISYDELCEKLGESSEYYDDYKSDAEWIVSWEDGTIATIYNYKDGRNYLGAEGLDLEDIRDWHIGGSSHKAVEKVYELFGKELKRQG